MRVVPGLVLGFVLAFGAGVARPVHAADGIVPKVLWDRVLGERARGGVAVGDGTVFLALMDETLRAFSLADGQLKWKAKIGSVPQTGPAYSAGVVLVVDAARRLVAFSASTGATLWEADLRGQASSEIGAGDGIVTIGEGNKSCAAFDLMDGRSLWQMAALGDVVSAPWIGGDAVVFGSTGHKLYAVSKSSGEIVREVTLTGEVYGRMGAEAAGVPRTDVFAALGTHDGRLHAFSTEWKKRWSAPVRGVVRAAPLLRGRMIYAGTDEAFLYAFKRRRGKVKWRVGIGGPVVDRIVPMGNRLVVGSGGAVKLIDARNGEIVHVLEMDGLVQGVGGEGGTIVAVTTGRRLVAAGVKPPEKAEAEAREKRIASVVLTPGRISVRDDERAVITFSLMEAGSLTVEVIDSKGRRVRLLTDKKKAWPDTYRFVWNGSDESGLKVVPGIYRVAIATGEEEVRVGLDVVGRR